GVDTAPRLLVRPARFPSVNAARVPLQTPRHARTSVRRHVSPRSDANAIWMRTKVKCFIVVFVLLVMALGVVGCEGYYGAYPGYGPYYGGPYYGAPYYGGYPASVSIAVGDRPYHIHGPGYYAGHTYYGWRTGHWAWRHHQRVWIHGHYVVR